MVIYFRDYLYDVSYNDRIYLSIGIDSYSINIHLRFIFDAYANIIYRTIINFLFLFNSFSVTNKRKKKRTALYLFSHLLSIRSIEHSCNHPYTITSSFGLKIPNQYI